MPIYSRRNNPENIVPRFLCLDTCTILDIIREPTRDDVRVQDHTASLDLLHIAERGEDIKVFVAEQVRKEFLANVETVQNDAKKSLSKFREQVSKIHQLANLHGASGRIDLSHLDNYDVRCRNVVDRWLKVSSIISPSDQSSLRANKRALLARTPAGKGKDSFKDCVVLETYIECIRELRGDGITTPAVFVSSNTKDYAGAGGAIFKDDIKSELDELGLEYAPNMSAAKHFLKL